MFKVVLGLKCLYFFIFPSVVHAILKTHFVVIIIITMCYVGIFIYIHSRYFEANPLFSHFIEQYSFALFTLNVLENCSACLDDRSTIPYHSVLFPSSLNSLCTVRNSSKATAVMGTSLTFLSIIAPQHMIIFSDLTLFY